MHDGRGRPPPRPSDRQARVPDALACPPFLPSGRLILDPFLGSGSTMAAARIEGRRCVGSELDTSYLPLIDARVRSTAAFDPLF